MYRIGILEKDEAYAKQLAEFLQKHHQDSFEIHTQNPSQDEGLENAAQYDALFLGDGVDIEEKLPAGIPVGYLTEQEEVNDRCISKYQSLEQIYRRMLALCEQGKIHAHAPDEAADSKPDGQQCSTVFGIGGDFSLEAHELQEDGETYRVYHIDDKVIDRLAVKMLTGNRIEGLLQISYHDGELKACITGLKSLYAYVQENNDSKGRQQLIRLFASMFETMLSLEEYMLSSDKLMLNPREIYVDEEKGTARLPYIPVKSSENKDAGQCLKELRGLCDVLLEGIGSKAAEVLVKEDIYGSTEHFERLQKNAKDSLKLRENTKTLDEEKRVPYLIRKRTGEQIVINRNIFKLGKDASYVDYCIKNNPTVSRNHADIIRKQDGYYLTDKGSLNHTFVNGRKLESDECRKLESGCLMQLADEVFEFHLK
ncbi:MAG: FHA domain-containing protein [Lachnospiraceae bacterium]|nr:FHA domain-containing protein [Lachnospiraceae bacterium]